jgi:hypothetical protein
VARRKHDFYPTPSWATEELLKRTLIQGRVFECCVGDGAISKVLEQEPGVSVVTNDIDRAHKAHYYGDASSVDFWNDNFWNQDNGIDWVVTNPPFNAAAEIVPTAFTFAKRGIAMLLRLSFLEPTEDRGSFLNTFPPTDLIVLPRISFTGDGKTDSVTCAWMVWDKQSVGTVVVAENPKFLPKAA